MEKRVLTKRINSIDRFRGILVFAMIIFQAIDRFPVFGFLTSIAKHDITEGIVLLNGLTLADVVAPMFFFAIALTIIPSFNKKAQAYGTMGAYRYFFVRYLALMGVGNCFSCIDSVADGGCLGIYIFGSIFIPNFLIGFIIACIILLSVIINLVLPKKDKLLKVKSVVSKITTYAFVINGILSFWVGFINIHNNFVLQNGTRVWDVLQAIGLAGLIVTCFANKNTIFRLIAGVVMFTAFTVFHQIDGMEELIDIDVQGGFIGAFSWASMVLIYTCIADLFYMDKESETKGLFSGSKFFILYIYVTIVLGIIGYFMFDINKGSVSPGYVLVTLPISTITFFLISLLENFKPKFSPFIWWGKSPLLMFVLQYVFVNIVCTVIIDPDNTSLFWAIIYILALIGVLTFIAYKLDKNNKVVKL